MFNHTLIAAGAGLVILVTASTAPAQDAPPVEPPPPTTTVPKITTKPAVAGVLQEGQELTVTAAWTGEPTPTVEWQWQRCNADGESCKKVAGATSDRYVLAKTDVGKRMRVKLVVTNIAGKDDARSQPTAVVVALPPPAPEPGPSPEPQPGPSPAPSPSKPPPFTSPGPPPPPRVVASPGSPALLRPFPIVRLRGVLTRTGVRIDVFSVRVPANVSVSVRCRGISCPSRRLARRASARGTVRLTPLERRMRAGTRLTVKVTRPGWIGKWSTIVIRRGAAPRRLDQCAYPDAARPAPCPG